VKNKLPEAAPTAGPPAERCNKPPVQMQVPRPSKEEIALLPPYQALPLSRILLVTEASHLAFVAAEVARAGMVGFDTESKPIFGAGLKSDGPHVIQIATLDHAFIFQTFRRDTLAVLQEILESPHILKVGFGLNSDRGPLQEKLGIGLQSCIDVARAFRPLGYREAVGVKTAVAIALGQRLQKSRKATTSNWALPQLAPRQLQYAADDAHAALAVFMALGCPQNQPVREAKIE